jgi:hypothetical protein
VDVVGILIAHPWLAMVVGAGFSMLWFWRRRLLALIAAVFWLAYGVYEYLMFSRVLCSGECNIRVDILVIYPALLAFGVLGVVHSLMRGARRDAV